MDQLAEKAGFHTPHFKQLDREGTRFRAPGTMKTRSTLAEALARIKGNAVPRPHYLPSPVDVTLVRSRTGMTQTQFARRFGFPVATLRHWERGNRKPRGSALVLLNLIDRNPQAILQAISGPSRDLSLP